MYNYNDNNDDYYYYYCERGDDCNNDILYFDTPNPIRIRNYFDGVVN